MADIRVIGAEEITGKLSWPGLVAALRAGHRLERPALGDQFLHRGNGTLLSRAAWIAGFGIGVKSVTVLPDNAARGVPTIHGGMLVFEDTTGQPEALIDCDAVTRWKTAGDSLLGASCLARPEPRTLLVLGAGVVAESLVEAYPAVFPSLETIRVWNRTPDKAAALAAAAAGTSGADIAATEDLASAAGRADIIAAATMARDPVLAGAWIRPGTHIDLIGAFTGEMREADDELMAKARIFVDCRETTVDHIGELTIPIANGAITHADVLGDLYDLAGGAPGRLGADDITVFKNGGGAHLDLMAARHILDRLAGQ